MRAERSLVDSNRCLDDAPVLANLRSRERPIRWWDVTIILLVLAPCGILGWNILYPRLKLAGPLPFERDGWASHVEPLFSEPLRFRMAKHLVTSGELLGRSEAEIRALLDTPIDAGMTLGTDMRVYAIRLVGGSDSLHLQIVFDSDRRVVRVIGPDE